MHFDRHSDGYKLMVVWDPITQTQKICVHIHGVGSIPTLASMPFVGILEEKASSFSEIFSGRTTPPLFGLNHFNSSTTR